MLPRMCEPNDPLMALGNAMGNFIICDPMPFFFSCIAIWLQDHDMHRGKPLYLSQERYAALTYLVASHSLDRTSEVLRQTTISIYGSD
jgi:hypothetical protein